MQEFDFMDRGRSAIFSARGTECIKAIAFVMAGLVPAIHALLAERKTWMPGTRPGMTRRVCASYRFSSAT